MTTILTYPTPHRRDSVGNICVVLHPITNTFPVCLTESPHTHNSVTHLPAPLPPGAGGFVEHEAESGHAWDVVEGDVKCDALLPLRCVPLQLSLWPVHNATHRVTGMVDARS